MLKGNNMLQKITVSKWFPNLSSKIQICAVYQKDNTLIAVSKILPAGNRGEAISTRKDSQTVKTDADIELPVKSIFLNQGQTLESLLEISGLQALPVVSNALKDIDNSEDLSYKFTM
jgi:hypothetical protein